MEIGLVRGKGPRSCMCGIIRTKTCIRSFPAGKANTRRSALGFILQCGQTGDIISAGVRIGNKW
jgi:hypothetical protein